MNAIEQLEELRTLESGWDGDGALPPNPELIDAAINFVRDTGIRPTRIVPVNDGKISIEWDDTRLRIESPSHGLLMRMEDGLDPFVLIPLPVQSKAK